MIANRDAEINKAMVDDYTYDTFIQRQDGESRQNYVNRLADQGWNTKGEIDPAAMRLGMKDGAGTLQWFGKTANQIEAMQKAGTWASYLEAHRYGAQGGGGAAGGGTGGPGGSGPGAGLTGGKKSAFDLMFGLLDQYGLGTLGGKLKELIQGGITDQASLTLELQNTNEWKQRFVGNEQLRKSGLPVLSVAEYLATERSYAQIMKNYGLPKGFYDDPSDFGKFIGSSVSPTELQDRVQSYADLANREDPAMKAQLASMGMGQGDLLAFMMDPERAAPLVQKKYKTALIGASARRTGLTSDNAYAEKLAGMGITEQQAQAGYAVISENLADTQRLGDIHGQSFGQGDFEAEVFEGSGAAAKKRKGLASQERAAFSGSSGVAQGSLRQSTAGSY